MFDLVVLYSAYCRSALFGSNNGLVQAILIIIIRLTKLLSDIAPLVLCLVPSTSTVTVQWSAAHDYDSLSSELLNCITLLF